MNQPIKISAMFTGTDSIGYQTGKTYNLFLDNKKGLLAKKSDLIIWDADDKENKKPCEYGSVKAFLKNWSMVISNERSLLFNTVHALLQTKHSRVIFAIESALQIENVFVKKPAKRFRKKELLAGDIDEKAISNSRIIAQESITQFEHTLNLLRSNEWVVGSNDLELALREFARTNFSDMSGEKFAGDIIEILKKRVVTE